MTALLVWDPTLAEYRFPAHHPMKPERFTLAVELMRAWGLLAEDQAATDGTLSDSGSVPRARVVRPRPATTSDLRLFHTDEYIAAVQAASIDPFNGSPSMGLGDADTPTFPGMHEAASLAVGATMLAVDSVLGGQAKRAFNPAGGLHHAHRSRAAGFCIYNDCAIAIEHAVREHDGLHVAYVDIDAHHGDGVEEAFSTRRDVLTVSVHESGRYLFPGSGDFDDIGTNHGVGFTLNVPLPPGAGPACFELVFQEIIRPALHHFAPDIIVTQIGADSNVADPLTHLRQTVAGELGLVAKIIDCADAFCGGRIVLTGGGGYEPFSVVPRIWAGAMALLMGVDVPTTLPPEWIASATAAAASYGLVLQPPSGTYDETPPDAQTRADISAEEGEETALIVTQATINRVRHASPLLGGGR